MDRMTLDTGEYRETSMALTEEVSQTSDLESNWNLAVGSWSRLV